MNQRTIWHTVLAAKPALTLTDVTAAVNVAKPRQGFSGSSDAIADVLDAINLQLHRLILAWTAGGIEETADISGILKEITSACEGVGRSFASRLAGEGVRAIEQEELARRVGASLDPILFALKDTAGLVFGMSKPADEIAQMLLRVEQLGEVCRQTQLRFRDGAAARAAVQNPPNNRHARDLGFAVIQAYPVLTGNAVQWSRTSSPGNAGRPSGPLIRFVQTMFERARAAIEADPAFAHVVDRLGLNPPSETIVSWTKQVKKLQKEESGQT